jgi:hypothetical protein
MSGENNSAPSNNDTTFVRQPSFCGCFGNSQQKSSPAVNGKATLFQQAQQQPVMMVNNDANTTSTSTEVVPSNESGPVVFGFDGKPVVIAPLAKPATATGAKVRKPRKTDRGGKPAFSNYRRMNAASALGSIGTGF